MGVEGMTVGLAIAIILFIAFMTVFFRAYYYGIRLMIESRKPPNHWGVFGMWRKKNLTEKGQYFRRQFFRHHLYICVGGFAYLVFAQILEALGLWQADLF